ncbi:alpha/beta hydrolase [Pseudonocardia sichuanensis]
MTITTRRRAARAGVLVAVLGLTAACGQAAPAAPPPAITWQDCHDGLQCGRITVPADWNAPEGPEEITIALGRFPARDPATRIGTVVLGPGGPNPLLFGLPRLAPQIGDLTRWFDVVVFDPRGMGESSGVPCPAAPPALPTWTEPDRATYDGYAAANQRFVSACTAALGPLHGKIDSWQVAHDLDAIRAALGEEKLRYFGNSYGTVYGQAYAELFGDRIERMYLDSVIDHTTTDVSEMLAPKAAVLEQNLHEFADWCAREPGCALHGRDALAVWDEVAAAPGSEVLVGSAAVMVRRPDRWSRLATALAAAAAGDPADFAPAPPPAGRDGGSVPGGYLMSLATCADLPAVDHEELSRITAELRATTPRLGWTEAFNTHGRCAGLPTGTYLPRPIPEQDLPPILVAGGESDSATPPEYGRRVAAQLDDARYLSASGGHARYLSGDPCVRQVVDRYLVSGQVPAPGARCPA